MICFKDMTFCSASDKCDNRETCHRWFSPVLQQAAVKWWGSDEYPLAVGDFSSNCDKFKEISK